MAIVIALTGCQISPEAYPELEPSEQRLSTDRAGGHVTPESDTTPNPVGVESITTRAERYAPRHFSDLAPECHGFVARRPAMVVDPTEPLDEVTLTASGDAQIIVVEHPDGSTSCAAEERRPELTGDNWSAGQHRVYVGTRQRYQRFRYDLFFEDPNAPLTIPWLDDQSMSRTDSIGQLEQPVQWSAELQVSERRPLPPMRTSPECLDDSKALIPRPIGHLQLEEDTEVDLAALSGATVELIVVGPLSEDRRESPRQCLPARPEQLALESGDYLVFAAVAESQLPTALEFVILGPTTEVEPMFLATTPGEELPVRARALIRHFPFISANTLWFDDKLRAYFFEHAPAELLVAAGDEVLDAQIFVATDRTSGGNYRELGDETALNPGEVLLLVDDQGHALTADGLLVSVDPDQLVPVEESEQLHHPDEPRSPQLTLDEALSLITSDDAPLLRDYKRLRQDYEFCREDIYRDVDDKIAELEAEGASTADIDALVDRTESRIRTECDHASMQRERETLRQQLQNVRTERRRNSLKDNASRIDSLRE